MAISLILATIHRTEEVGRLVQSLLVQTHRCFELIVVDQNPDERLIPYVRLARENGLDIRHEKMDKPGLSAARNLGIELAKYSIVAFPDDDCWYEPTVIEGVVSAFKLHDAPGGVIARWVEQAGMAFADSYPLDINAWRNFRGGHASSITLFINRALFQTLGGFDDRFGVGKWYGAAEETDFILRALMSGARLQYCPELKVHHVYSQHPHGTIATLCRQARQRSRGTGAIYAKHKISMYVILRGVIAPLIVLPLQRMKPAVVARAVFTSLGRLEGYLRWKLRES